MLIRPWWSRSTGYKIPTHLTHTLFDRRIPTWKEHLVTHGDFNVETAHCIGRMLLPRPVPLIVAGWGLGGWVGLVR